MSTHGSAMALSKKSFGIFSISLYLYEFEVFMFMKSINIFLSGSALCQLMEQLQP